MQGLATDLVSRGVSFQECTSHHWMLCIWSEMFWKIERHVVKLCTVPKPTWAIIRGTAGKRERREAPIRVDRAESNSHRSCYRMHKTRCGARGPQFAWGCDRMSDEGIEDCSLENTRGERGWQWSDRGE
jgi:hypothetical protein